MSVGLHLVDAHDDARTSLARRLSRDPRLELVGTASSVEEAASILLHTRPDIVLLGIHPSDGRGVDACRALKELSEAPVVVFTSFVTPDLWEAFREAGAADYLLKHIDTDRLSREILRLARRHRRGTPRNTYARADNN